MAIFPLSLFIFHFWTPSKCKHNRWPSVQIVLTQMFTSSVAYVDIDGDKISWHWNEQIVFTFKPSSHDLVKVGSVKKVSKSNYNNKNNHKYLASKTDKISLNKTKSLFRSDVSLWHSFVFWVGSTKINFIWGKFSVSKWVLFLALVLNIWKSIKDVI